MKIKQYLLCTALSINSFAHADVYLKLLESRVQLECDKDFFEAVEAAKTAVLAQLPDPSKYEIVADWKTTVGFAGGPFECTAVVSTAKASFVETARKNEAWFVNLEGRGYTKDSPKHDAEGWEDSLRYSALHAKFACNNKHQAPIVFSKETIHINEGKKVRMYISHATFPCDK